MIKVISHCCEAPLLQCVAGQCPSHHKTTCGLKKNERCWCQPLFRPEFNYQNIRVKNLLNRFLPTPWTYLRNDKHKRLFETAKSQREHTAEKYNLFKENTCLKLSDTTEPISTTKTKTTPIPQAKGCLSDISSFPSVFSYQGSVGHHRIHRIVPSRPC